MYPIVILAGGIGSRLGLLTKKTPKALIRIENKPFIHYQLKQLSKQGFNEVLICAGYLSRQIKKFAGIGKKFNLKIKYSIEKKKLLGTAGAIRKALPLLNDNFFIIYGDTYLPIKFKNLQKIYIKKKAKALITIYKNKNKLDKSNVCFKKKNIYYEKNSNKKNMNYIEYGVSILNKSIFNYKNLKKISDLSEVFNYLSKKKILKYAIVRKRFYEIGSVSGLLQTKKFFTKK
jgi:NDP-sugar pyrophosphorylase family protein